MSKVIVHIDLNAFFARAEEIKDPSLENKPLAIGHLGRAGIVSTCSYAARKYGVHSAMPMSQAKKLCPDLIIKPGDYRFYSLLSHQFINFVKRYTKIIEVASCDECYADFTDTLKNVKDCKQLFLDLQQQLFKETKLKCSIGVGPTKFLAKMGSDYKKPMGLTIIRKRDIPSLLYPLPIEDMFLVGKRSAPRLRSVGINTIGDLAKAFDNKNQDVINILGKLTTELSKWLKGEGSDEVITEFDEAKSVSASLTLEEDTDSIDIIQRGFEEACHELIYRLNRENKYGTTIQIMVKDNEYKAHNKSLTIDTPTNKYETIFTNAMKLYMKNYQGMIIRAVGVALQNLADPKDTAIQMTLFDYQKHEEESTTKLLINELNRKLDKPMLKRASEAKKK